MNTRSVILVVDSDQDNREMCAAYLSSKGYVAVTASVAEEAMILASDADVVITETRLSGAVDGLDFISALRRDSRTKSVPVITLSATVTSGERDRAFDCGADVFLCKPCVPAALLSRVRRMVRISRHRASSQDAVNRQRTARQRFTRPDYPIKLLKIEP